LAYPVTVSWVQGENRTEQQNALVWKWASEVAKQRGDTYQSKQHAEFKLEIGVKIARGRNDKFRALYDSCLLDLDYERKINIMEAGYPVTRNFKKLAMIEFITRVQEHCAQRNWIITDPDPGLAEWMQATTDRKGNK